MRHDGGLYQLWRSLLELPHLHSYSWCSLIYMNGGHYLPRRVQFEGVTKIWGGRINYNFMLNISMVYVLMCIWACMVGRGGLWKHTVLRWVIKYNTYQLFCFFKTKIQPIINDRIGPPVTNGHPLIYVPNLVKWRIAVDITNHVSHTS